MAKLGMLLILISIAALAFVLSPLFLDDKQPVLNVLEPVFCAPGERLSMTVIVTRDSDGTGYSGDYDCMRRDETTYDVTAKAFFVSAAAFTAPFLLGLALLITGFNREVRGVIPTNTVHVRTWGASRARPPLVQATTAPSQAYNFDATPAADSSPDLATRLKQLRDAYDSGMLTYVEYERTKADLLKDFSNVE